MQPENTTPIQPPITPDPTPPTAPLAAPTPNPTPAPEQPTFGQTQPAVQKRSKKKLFFIGLAIFVLFIVLGGVVAFTSTSKSVKTADEFVAALTKKDYGTAYSYFSPELKEQQSAEQFKSTFENAPFDSRCVFKVQTREASNSSSQGTTKNLIGNIQCGSSSYPTEFTFITKDGTEKILAYSVKPTNL